MATHSTSTAIAVGARAVLIGGPKLGLLVVLISSFFAELFLRHQIWKKDPTRHGSVVLFNTTQLASAVVLAGLLFQALGGQSPPYKSLMDFVRAAAVFLVFVIVNHALVAGVGHFSQGLHCWRHLRTILRVQRVLLVSSGIIAILIAVTCAASPWYTFLTLSPLFVVQISLRERLKLREQAKRTFEKIAQIVNTHDPYTGVHSEEVAELAVKLAQALKLPQKDLERIGAAACVHDLGKIAVPDAILLKPGPLDEKEWEILKKHPVVSAEILEGLEIYKGGVEIVRHEHEHWDGSGYPDGLKGGEIP